ncbi:conserved hypothetical protein [Treponema primitia ZAS-2]|uniref:DUF2802 domain-containing protein n=1 Tax=Treponema primitia (strain ATCC BAA-887 / DSM 12427 / ZAS-2) TaxID=545694 RepID=F5YPV3_TREPZ|nr:hypothetical protein [Treponema primitia]AEF85334.1 conserved hypothetical protein [Treponema primitia ZAS-2]
MTLSILLSAASLIICGFSFIYLQSYLRRRTGAERILADFEEEVDKIIAGIDAATDRDITLLEDKAKSIKALLETLDRRIAAYARELERRNTQESALNTLAGEGSKKTAALQTEKNYAALGRGLRSLTINPGPETAPPGAPPPQAVPGSPYPPAAGGPGPNLTGSNPIEPGSAREPQVEAGPEAPSSPRFTRSPTQLKPKAPLTERVSELSLNGFSPETIAARLGVTIAEVDLALAISRREARRGTAPEGNVTDDNPS